MIEASHGDVRLLHFERLSRAPGLRHAVTVRPQNYAPHRGIGREDAIRWRRRVCGVLGVPFERLTAPSQVHGPDVLAIGDGDVGRGRDGRGSAVPFVDGLMTDTPGVPIIQLSADCPLVCVLDPDRPATGAVHASWRGTVAGASVNLVRQLSRTYGSRPERLRAAIAPSAGPCCYEVGEEVRRIARSRHDGADEWFVEAKGRLMLDLWAANRSQLVDAGLAEDNIEVARVCSICDERFWSHRRDGNDAGRFALFLSLV